MKKSEFVALVAEQTGLSKKDTEKTVDTAFAMLGDVLARGDKLQVSGFGTFEPKARAARTVRDPRTDQPLEVAAALIPTFKPSKILKEKVDAK